MKKCWRAWCWFMVMVFWVVTMSRSAWADNFTWDGSVDRRWGSLVFDPAALALDSNWNLPTLPGGDDIVRFDGSSPGEVLIGGPSGSIKEIRAIVFDSPQAYRLSKDDFFGGEIRLGEDGILVDAVGQHVIEADLKLTTAVTSLDIQRAGAELELRGKLGVGNDLFQLFKQGDGRLRLTGLDPGSGVDTFRAIEGLTIIDGGELTVNRLTVGSEGSVQGDPVVSTLNVKGAPDLTVGELQLARLSSENFIEFHGPGTQLTTDLVGSDLADFRLDVEDGAMLHLTGPMVQADRFDEIVVREAQLRIDAIDMTAGAEAMPLRIQDPSSGGEALVIGLDRDSRIDTDIIDTLGQGSLRKVGTGRLTLNGRNTFTGKIIVAAGELSIGPEASFGDGGAIDLAEAATLVSRSDVLRPIQGPGGVLALRDVLLGDFTDERGFDAGRIDLASRDVVLLDQDHARLHNGVSNIDGGRLRSTAGLLIDAGGELRGHGTVDGELVNRGLVEGSDDGLVLNGPVTGSGDFLGSITFNGLFEPGDSPARTNMGSPDFRRWVRMELAGRNPDEFDELAIRGEAWLDGTLEVILLNDFTPTLGDRFDLLRAVESGVLSGAFQEIRLPELADGLDWRVDASPQALSVRVIPEPGTLVFLVLSVGCATARRRTG